MDDKVVKKLASIESMLMRPAHKLYHFCNVCNNNVAFRRFLYRPNAVCPMCGSMERHRAMAIQIWPILPMLWGANILHFAPESHIKAILTSVPVHYIGTNFVPSDKYNVDIRDIKFADNYFDLIIINQILEHIDDDEAALSELYRVLAPGGGIIVTVPLVHQYQQLMLRRTDGSYIHEIFNQPSDATYYLPDLEQTPENLFIHYGQKDHLRIYGKRDLVKLFKKSGFKVVVFSPSMYPKELSERLNIIDDVFFLRK